MMENQLSKIHVFLLPVMSTITRSALLKIQTNPNVENIPNRELLFLQIVRSTFDLKQVNTLRIRQGLKMLMDILQLTPEDIQRGMRNTAELCRYGIIRSQDQKAQALSVIEHFVKTIDYPTGHFGAVLEQVEPIKPVPKPVLSDYEIRRLKEKAERLTESLNGLSGVLLSRPPGIKKTPAEEEIERRRLLKQQRERNRLLKKQRKRNSGVRYLVD